jgi:NADPH2:quinone reductase
MKAVLVTEFGGPEVLKFTTVSDPVPGPEQVLIRVKVAGINFGDILARRGKHHIKRTPPFIAGLDLTGSIIAVGADVKNLEIGQRVVAFAAAGSYAELAVANQTLTFPIPDTIDDETAASFPVCAGTAYKILTAVACLQAGESVLIHCAAGGVGTIAVQLAKFWGASLIVGATGTAAKFDFIQSLGADAVINSGSENYPEKINALTNGQGINVILNSVAGETIEKDLECLAPFGRLVVFGHASGKPGSIFSEQLQGANRSVLGFSFGTIRHLNPASVTATMEPVIQLIAQNRIKTFGGHRFGLEAAESAHRLMESRKATGKVLLYTAS